jgi:hypothetical protein
MKCGDFDIDACLNETQKLVDRSNATRHCGGGAQSSLQIFVFQSNTCPGGQTGLKLDGAGGTIDVPQIVPAITC